MSGYDKSPDYGGPEPSKREIVVVLALVFAGTLIAAVLILLSPAGADSAHFPLCGSGTRYTCVVDGDTVWLRGEKIRLALIDAPEKHDPKCTHEALQAAEATRRLADLLNGNEWRLERRGMDRYGRTLGVFWIGNRAAGEILIAEGLARRWDGRRHPWC